nr:uncharacterized protein LOC111417561 [Onthophagus taurus]
MKIYIVLQLTIIFVTIHFSTQLENLLDSPVRKCIECVCHARTGCFNRMTCASYSISMNYWHEAGSPTLNVNDPANTASYNACMRDENCILNTIKLYTDRYEKPECDCNDVYDCRDMLMIHLNGQNCNKVISNDVRSRYNKCAQDNGLQRIVTDSRCRPDPQ